jgi:tyrosyl-tRNA synthetase
MSKSLDNYIALTDSPRDMFGKTMSIPDTLITRWLEYAAFAEPAEVEEVGKGLTSGDLHPRNAKVDLAKRIVARYHDQQAADEAFAEFERVFVKKDVPDEMPTFTVEVGILEMGIVPLMHASGSAASNSEARRLIGQGGVQVDGEKVTDMNAQIDVSVPRVLRTGKLKFVRIVPGT